MMTEMKNTTFSSFSGYYHLYTLHVESLEIYKKLSTHKWKWYGSMMHSEEAKLIMFHYTKEFGT